MRKTLGDLFDRANEKRAAWLADCRRLGVITGKAGRKAAKAGGKGGI
jgi:hypothetical protein